MAIAATKVKMVQQRTMFVWTEMNGFTHNGSGDTFRGFVDTTNVVIQPMAATEHFIGPTLPGPPTGPDQYRGIVLIPTEWDKSHPIYVKLRGTYATPSPNDTIDWTFKYTALSVGEVMAAPATSVVMTQQTWAANSNQAMWVSTEQTLAADTFTDSDKYLFMEVESTNNAGAPGTRWYGVEFRYTPKFYKGLQLEAPLWSNT